MTDRRSNKEIIDSLNCLIKMKKEEIDNMRYANYNSRRDDFDIAEATSVMIEDLRKYEIELLGLSRTQNGN